LVQGPEFNPDEDMVTQSRNDSLVMQHEGFITTFSNHSIGPYPELDESTPFFDPAY
jgi:hypothetical protein